jgi:hypothetical protein
MGGRGEAYLWAAHFSAAATRVVVAEMSMVAVVRKCILRLRR